MEYSLLVNGKWWYQNPLAQIVLMVCMIIPAISAILTSFITKENIKDLWIKPNFKNNKKFYLIAWFLPAILIVLGAGVYYLVFPSHFDLSMSTFIKLTQGQMVAMGQVAPSVEELRSLLIMQMIIAVFTCTYIKFYSLSRRRIGMDEDFYFQRLMKNIHI